MWGVLYGALGMVVAVGCTAPNGENTGVKTGGIHATSPNFEHLTFLRPEEQAAWFSPKGQVAATTKAMEGVLHCKPQMQGTTQTENGYPVFQPKPTPYGLDGYTATLCRMPVHPTMVHPRTYLVPRVEVLDWEQNEIPVEVQLLCTNKKVKTLTKQHCTRIPNTRITSCAFGNHAPGFLNSHAAGIVINGGIDTQCELKVSLTAAPNSAPRLRAVRLGNEWDRLRIFAQSGPLDTTKGDLFVAYENHQRNELPALTAHCSPFTQWSLSQTETEPARRDVTQLFTPAFDEEKSRIAHGTNLRVWKVSRQELAKACDSHDVFDKPFVLQMAPTWSPTTSGKSIWKGGDANDQKEIIFGPKQWQPLQNYQYFTIGSEQNTPSDGTKTKVLTYGFRPFGERKTNDGDIAIQKMWTKIAGAGSHPGPIQWMHIILPVEYLTVSAWLGAVLETHRPDIVIGVGEGAGTLMHGIVEFTIGAAPSRLGMGAIDNIGTAGRWHRLPSGTHENYSQKDRPRLIDVITKSTQLKVDDVGVNTWSPYSFSCAESMNCIQTRQYKAKESENTSDAPWHTAFIHIRVGHADIGSKALEAVTLDLIKQHQEAENK